jgi:CRP-like cAMP-binding protein
MDSYAEISAETWLLLRGLCKFRKLAKHEILYPFGQVPGSFSYIYTGLFRTYVVNEKGNEYNKNFFAEASFPGSMTALLTAIRNLRLRPWSLP